MDEIPFPNAFTNNELGIYGSSFPFCVDYNQQDEVVRLFICPQRVKDICDLLEMYASEMITVFDVVCTEENAQTGELLTIVELAEDAKIEFSQIDVSTIVLSIKDLSRLLSGYGYYAIHMFDVGPNWNEDEIISQVITCREYVERRLGSQILPSISQSRLFLTSEEDWSLSMESDNSLLLKRVFARTLQIYAGIILIEDNLLKAPVLSEMTNDVIDGFWNNKLDLTMLREMTTYIHGKLQIGVSKRAFSFLESGEYPIDFLIEYDIANQTWTVAK